MGAISYLGTHHPMSNSVPSRLCLTALTQTRWSLHHGVTQFRYPRRAGLPLLLAWSCASRISLSDAEMVPLNSTNLYTKSVD
jgi:hypothetical protein